MESGSRWRPNTFSVGASSRCHLPKVDETDRLLFRVKDTGLFGEEYLLGMLGPKIIASGSLAIGQDFEGYLELEPCREIGGNGRPVLQIHVRFSIFGYGEVPGRGNTHGLSSVFEGPAVEWPVPVTEQALAEAAAAPSAPHIESAAADQEALAELLASTRTFIAANPVLAVEPAVEGLHDGRTWLHRTPAQN